MGECGKCRLQHTGFSGLGSLAENVNDGLGKNPEAFSGAVLGGLGGAAAGLWLAKDGLTGVLLGATLGAIAGMVLGGRARSMLSR